VLFERIPGCGTQFSTQYTFDEEVGSEANLVSAGEGDVGVRTGKAREIVHVLIP